MILFEFFFIVFHPRCDRYIHTDDILHREAKFLHDIAAFLESDKALMLIIFPITLKMIIFSFTSAISEVFFTHGKIHVKYALNMEETCR